MSKYLFMFFILPALGLAQTTFPTVFPSNAIPVSSEVLRDRLTGKSFIIKATNGPEIRLQYKDTFAFLSTGPFSDSGKWRVEGSAVCVDWQRFPPSCSEVRLVNDVIYTVRSSNGEVVEMQPR